SGDFTLVRYNSDGSRDNSFGSNGVVSTDFSRRNERAQAVALQPDGKIVVAGSSGVMTPNGYDSRVALARYLPSGALDRSFGKQGTVLTSIGQGAAASTLAILGDGRMLVAGWTIGSSGGQNFLLARYTSGGSLDSTFGSKGVVSRDFFG